MFVKRAVFTPLSIIATEGGVGGAPQLGLAPQIVDVNTKNTDINFFILFSFVLSLTSP